MRILLVDDELEIVENLKEILMRENFSCDATTNPLEVESYLSSAHYDLLILDIMMPKLDGYSLLKRLRENSNDIPVIFLSAKKEVEDKLMGLDLGADDYLSKPFNSKELIARIRAIIRRKNNFSDNVLEFNGLKLDISSYKLIYGSNEVLLVNKEFQILELFFLNPNKMFSTNEILDKVWNYDSYSDISTVWSFISNIRKKIAKVSNNFVLKSNRGLGYSLVCLKN